jgi:spore coat polysaccharide biosynthesis protein SpsF
MRVVAIIAARMNSTRFKGKVMMPLKCMGIDLPVIWRVYDQVSQAIGVDEVVVATTKEPIDDDLADFMWHHNILCWRGSEDNVLERFYDAAVAYRADAVVRITGDCPLLDPYVISEVVALFRRHHPKVHFANNTEPPTYPDGLDTEVVSMQALRAAHQRATLPSDRDTVCQWISRHQAEFPAKVLINPIPDMEIERWVLDTAEDYEFVQAIYKRLDCSPSLPLILDILRREPKLREINAQWKRNERFLAQVSRHAGA